jgi:glutathione peroxidase
MNLYDVPLTTLAGEPLDSSLLRGRATLIVNVASKCGLTPQYEGLQRLYDRYSERGFVVVGTPCDQFGGQEPGTADEIDEFCSSSYSVTFPLTEKLDVNGPARHPLFESLTALPDGSGAAGDVHWNFEKFLVSPRGEAVARFRPMTTPEDEELVAAIEATLPEHPAPVWVTRPAADVKPGDRVVSPRGAELTATRICERFLGVEDLLCLVEDTPARWLAEPLKTDAVVNILSLPEASGREPAAQ